LSASAADAIGSAIVILIGLGSIAIQKGLKMSIDFAGGALVECGPRPVPCRTCAPCERRGQGAEITRFGAEQY
jgi:preprotein translocase subunit SecF